jgi:hypothetical protein
MLCCVACLTPRCGGHAARLEATSPHTPPHSAPQGLMFSVLWKLIDDQFFKKDGDNKKH